MASLNQEGITMKTTYGKTSMGNNQGQTYHDLPNGLTLKITTQKNSAGKLQTTATCCKQDTTDGIRFETHRVFQDFYQVIYRTSPARVTMKAIQTQHENQLQNLDLITQEALNHYNTPEYIAKYGKEAA